MLNTFYAAVPVGLIRQFFEHFGKLAEISKLMGAAAGVFRARRRQHKYLRAVEPLLLQTRLARPLREILKGTHAIEGNDLRGILFDFLSQQDAPLGEFLALQFLDSARGTFDKVGQSYSEFDHS